MPAPIEWLGHLPGGLAMATIVGCAGFSAVCGSSIATTTTVAAVAWPEMREYKYSPNPILRVHRCRGTMAILRSPAMPLSFTALLPNSL